MSQQYQVLARKYRPKNFHELVGQSHVSKALINAIDHNRLHHAYLFTGTRGVGKTTIARILSKCLNCETGVTSTPCGVCSSCVAIDQGRYIDLIEIDAASRTKVEDTRELIDNVAYAPTQGRYKVYLIDEVHMLSTHSFNALLKTLEEPPAHVKFLLATTDPQKLPITIISRCLQFVLRPLPQQAISEHLANLLTLEGVNYTQPALWQLANAAKGSLRDALSLTDQAIAFGEGTLTDETVNDMLGLIDSADLVSLLLDIYQGNTEAVSAHIEQMRAQMVDAGSMFDGLAELLHQIAMLQLLPNVALNVNDKQANQIKRLASIIGPDVLQLYYQIVIQGREQIKLANTPLQALEMCLLRLLAFRPLAINEVPMPTAMPTQAQPDNTVSIPQPQSDLQPQSENSSSEIEPQSGLRNDNESEMGTELQSVNEPESEAENFNLQDDVIEDTDLIETVEDSNQPNTLTFDQQPAESTIEHNDSVIEDSDNGFDNALPDLTSDVQIDPETEMPNQKEISTPSQADSERQSITVQGTNVHPDTIIEAEVNTIQGKDSIKTENNNSDSHSNFELNTLFETKSGLKSPVSHNKADTIPSEDAKSSGIISEQQSSIKLNETNVNQDQSISTSTLNHPAENEKISKFSAEDPRSLLKCAPVELIGEWTPEKWDYWLQTARESGTLAYDQLAMARQGVMTGQISGKSVFKVAFDTKNMHSIFNHLANHLGDQFGAEVSIEVDTLLASNYEDLLPQNRQKLREVKAKDSAKELIIQSPVMQRLIHDSKGEITHLRLLDDTE